MIGSIVRFGLHFLLLCAVTSQAASQPASPPDRNWYREIQNKYFLEFHVPSDVTDIGIKFDAVTFARELKACGAEAVGVFAKDYFGNCYYPAQVGSVHPGLKFDLFGEQVRALKAEGLRVIAYYHVPGNEVIAAAHPEWHALERDGRSRPDGQHPTLSIQTEYYEKLMLEQIKEIMQYPIDGFFFDGSFLGWPDFSPTVRAQYKRDTGREIPSGPEAEGWFEYARWQKTQAEKWRVRMSADIHAINPNVLVTSNVSYTSAMPDDPPATGIDHLTIDIFGWAGFAELRRFASYDIPFDIMFTRMRETWYDWSMRPETENMLRATGNLANGGQLYYSDMYYPWGTTEPAALERAKKIFDYAGSIREWTQGARPAAEVAILFTEETYSAQGDGLGLWLNPSLLGCLKALWENHVYALNLSEREALERLDTLRVIVMPDVTHVSDTLAAALDAWVQRGGVLICTGDAGLYDEKNKRREDFALAQALGVRYRGASPQRDSYLTLSEELKGDLPDLPLQMRGVAALVEPAGARVAAGLMQPWNPGGPYHYTPHAGPQAPGPPFEKTEYAGITINRHGKGQAALIAGRIFEDYYLYANWTARPLLRNLLAVMDPTPQLKVEAPMGTEVTLMQQPGRLILHLVNWPELPKDFHVFQEVRALKEVKCAVRLEREPKGVRWGSEQQALKTRWEDPYVRFTIPRVAGAHDFVCIELGN